MTSDLMTLEELLSQGSLTCDLSDADDAVMALPMTFSWRSVPTPFYGPAQTVHAPQGDLDAVYEGLDAVKPGGVLVVETGGVDRAVWGETTTRAALGRGVSGVVLDGACRDVPAVRALGLPVVARGVLPQRAARTGRGVVGQRLEFYSVTVCPGDLIVSDDNGTVVVPQPHIDVLIDKILRVYKER